MRERLEASSADQRPAESAGEIAAILERGVEARLASTHAPSLVPSSTPPASSSTRISAGRRSPVSATTRVAELAAGYSNLEYDLATGTSGTARRRMPSDSSAA